MRDLKMFLLLFVICSGKKENFFEVFKNIFLTWKLKIEKWRKIVMNLEFDGGISIDLEIEKFNEKIDEMVEKVGLKWPY